MCCDMGLWPIGDRQECSGWATQPCLAPCRAHTTSCCVTATSPAGGSTAPFNGRTVLPPWARQRPPPSMHCPPEFSGNGRPHSTRVEGLNSALAVSLCAAHPSRPCMYTAPHPHWAPWWHPGQRQPVFTLDSLPNGCQRQHAFGTPGVALMLGVPLCIVDIVEKGHTNHQKNEKCAISPAAACGAAHTPHPCSTRRSTARMLPCTWGMQCSFGKQRTCRAPQAPHLAGKGAARESQQRQAEHLLAA